MNWKDVLNLARNTVNKEDLEKEPSASWKKRMLLAEHSPIRAITKAFTLKIPYWVSVHLVRHKYGVEHFVSTQRTDRTGLNRNEEPQGALVTHKMIANQQAIINISRKRLCSQASKETHIAWVNAIKPLEKTDPELYSVLVPECVYRGFCPEMSCCGYSTTNHYKQRLEEYRKV